MTDRGTRGDGQDVLAMNRVKWDGIAPHFVAGTALPIYGPLAPTEDELRLIPPIAGMRTLELGCGSGHSLLYLADRGAAEVWGLDLSATQVKYAQALLDGRHVPTRLFQAPMETNPGLPTNYFDLVLSIYGLGWTTDLAQTLSLVASYLKPGGTFVFSWEHPFYRCVASVEGRMEMQRSYHVEGSIVEREWFGEAPVTTYHRKVSTFINGVLEAGMTIERMIEAEVDTTRRKPAHENPARWYSIPRARLIPTTLIIRARKSC